MGESSKSSPKKITVKVRTAGEHPMWGAGRQFSKEPIEVELTEHEVFQLKADQHFVVEGGPALPENWPHHAQDLGQHPVGSPAPAPTASPEPEPGRPKSGAHEVKPSSWSHGDPAPEPEAHNRKGKG